MATRKGATKTVSGKRFRYNGTKWVQITSKGNVTPTSSSNRASRSKRATNTPTTDTGRNNRGGSRVTSDTTRTSTGSAKVTTKPLALPPGQRGGALTSTDNKPRRRNINSNPSSNTTRTATGSKPNPKPTPTKPSLRSRAYVKARQLGINPTTATNAVAKNARFGRLNGVTAGAALLEAGLSATPGPTGRRVRASRAEFERKRSSVQDMAKRKGRQVLETLGLVDRNPTTKTKPATKTKPNSTGLTDAQRKALADANKARIARIKKESDAKTAAGKNDPRSPFYKAPSSGNSGGGGNNPNPKPKPKPETKTKPKPKSKIHTYKKHGSDLHVGRHKTLKEHRAAVAANKKKKNNSALAIGGYA